LTAATLNPPSIEAIDSVAMIRTHFPRASGFITFMLTFRQIPRSMFTRRGVEQAPPF
jgi:hypothetical protein